jgi:hypothetical protein
MPKRGSCGLPGCRLSKQYPSINSPELHAPAEMSTALSSVPRYADTTSRDFVPWRFLDAGQLSARVFSLLPASKNQHNSRRLLCPILSNPPDDQAAARPHPSQPSGASWRWDHMRYWSVRGSTSFRKFETSRKNCNRFFSIIIVCVPSLSSTNRLYGVWVSRAKKFCA